MKNIVISLGGSVIFNPEVNISFLEQFKKTILKNKEYRFIIVTGGGKIARDYINALKKENRSKEELALAGVRATRMNAQFLMQLFGEHSNSSLPLNMEEVKNEIYKNQITICGALRHSTNSTSDSTAAKLANYLKADFINITNVSGLYTADPKTDKYAKLIKNISWEGFDRIISRIKFHAGQHFVLDQQASKIIKENEIRTYIIGSNKDLNNILNGKKFKGTLIFK
jgi:uridylate kinase